MVCSKTFLAAYFMGALGVLGQIPNQFTTGFNSSTITLTVSYGGNRVTDGDTLGLDVVKTEPTFVVGDSSGLSTNSRYIVIMVDPDAPSASSPTFANVLHFVKTDLRVGSTPATNITAGNSTTITALSYLPPAPPEGSGPHRYVFLLYGQPGASGFALTGLPDPGDRAKFNVSQWRIANGLQPAKAGTYFRAEFGANSSTPSTASSGIGPKPTASGTASGSATATGSSNAATGLIACWGAGTVIALWATAAMLGGFLFEL